MTSQKQVRKARIIHTIRQRYNLGGPSYGDKPFSLWRHGVAAQGEPRFVVQPLGEGIAKHFL